MATNFHPRSFSRTALDQGSKNGGACCLGGSGKVSINLQPKLFLKNCLPGYTGPMLTCSFHFGTFTPFTRSHRHNDNSPIKAGIRMAGDSISAKGGGRNNRKLMVLKNKP